MIRQSSSASRPNRLANRKASPFSKQSIAHAFRVMAPTLVALTFASAAHAQGTMDFSGAQTLMGTFNDRLAYVAISRASDDARIYTNNAGTLGERLATDITKTAALVVGNYGTNGSGKEPTVVRVGNTSAFPSRLPEIEGFGLGL